MEEIILETKELCKQYHKQTVRKGVYTGFWEQMAQENRH